jgi:hypothetical protein
MMGNRPPGLLIQPAHQVEGAGLDGFGAQGLADPGGEHPAPHLDKEKAQHRGRALADDPGQVAVHIRPHLFLVNEGQHLGSTGFFPVQVLAQAQQGSQRRGLLALGKNNIQTDDPGPGLLDPPDELGHDLPGPGPAPQFFDAFLVNGHQGDIRGGGPGSPVEEFQVVELEFDEFGGRKPQH